MAGSGLKGSGSNIGRQEPGSSSSSDCAAADSPNSSQSGESFGAESAAGGESSGEAGVFRRSSCVRKRMKGRAERERG